MVSILRSDTSEQLIETETWPARRNNHNLAILNSHLHSMA
jgi:hypothetical protein